MRKFRVLVGIGLCMVLLLGGVLPNLSTVHADEADSQITTKQLNLKVVDDKAHVVIERVEENEDGNKTPLYTGLDKENLPQNAVIRIALPENVNGKYKVSRVEVVRDGIIKETHAFNKLPDELQVYDGSTVSIVYEPTHDDFYSFDVTYYDYDYSCSSGDGINAERNYPIRSEESQRLQMGVRDDYHSGSNKWEAGYQYGSDLGATEYVVDVTLTRPDGATAVAGANKNHGVDDKTPNYGIDMTGKGGGEHEFWPIVTGLVTGLDANGNPVWGTNADGKQLVDPGFFTNESKLGKHIYTSQSKEWVNSTSLDYERDGYHYRLKRANVYGETTDVQTVSGSDVFSNPRFFPLDKVESATDEQKFVDPWHDLPAEIEDYEPHNWYFAIRQEFDFVVGQYDGPLEYTFAGDDDVWVFLDGKLVLDLGGLHCVYPNAYAPGNETLWSNTVDIRKELDKAPGDEGYDPDWRDKSHTITILYMERGGYDSNCYMEFTLPIKEAPPLDAVISIPARIEIKGKDAAEKDGNFPDKNTVTVKLISISGGKSTVVEEQKIPWVDGEGVIFSEKPLEDGVEYTVEAEEFPDFKGPEIGGDISNGYTLAYEYQPETRDINIKKVWDDSVIAAGKNNSIQVRVLADGEQYGELITLDKESNWEKTVSGLQKRKSKKEITYTIKEVNVPGDIVPSIDGNMDKGFVITNNMRNPITHTFVKKSSDMPDLPKEITDMCPSPTSELGGTLVSPTPPQNRTVAVADGTWTFEGYDEEGEVKVTGPVNFVGTWSFEPKATYKATYEFISGTSGRELPPEVMKYKWNDTIVMEGDKISAKKPYVTSVDVGSGFWEFQKWDNEGEVTVEGDDVHFTGTWTYRDKASYKVTHVFESGSDGQDLPSEVAALTPQKPETALEGDVISPTPLTTTIYEVRDENNHPIGCWTFKNWDTTNITVEEDVVFTGTWVYEEYPTCDVTYEFYSDTDGYKNLPEEVMNTKPYDTVVHQGDSIKPTRPSENKVEVKDGVWTFIGYDEADAEENITVNNDMTFRGKWHFERKTEYEVSYIYKSGTPGKNLPSEITEQLPESVKAMDGTEVIPESPQKEEVEADGGVWKFYGYDKPLVVVDGQDDSFTGIWIFVPDYQVTYRFVSGTEGYELPDAIKALLPEGTTASEGEKVIPKQPTYPDVEDKENGGVWQFKEWTPEEITVEKDEEFVGTWTFTKWNVTYEFVSGTSGRDLPPGVVDYLPEPTTAPIGSTVTAKIPEVTRVETPDGYWDFERYDKDDAEATSNVKFTGTWRYTAKPTYKVAYSFVSGTEGRALPKEVLDVIPRTVEGLKNNTVVKPAQPRSSSVSVSGGIWKFVSWDKTSLTVNGRDATFVGTWTFTANTTTNNNNNTNNNNSNNNNKPTNTANPVSPKTGEGTMAGTYAAATLAMVAGALIYYKKKEHKAR